MKVGKSTKKRPVNVNGVECESLSAAAKQASIVLSRKIFVWEIQRLLNDKKKIAGLETVVIA